MQSPYLVKLDIFGYVSLMWSTTNFKESLICFRIVYEGCTETSASATPCVWFYIGA